MRIFYFFQRVDLVFVGSQLIKLDVEDGGRLSLRKKEYKLQPQNYQSYARGLEKVGLPSKRPAPASLSACMMKPALPICKLWIRNLEYMAWAYSKNNSLLIDWWKCKMPHKCLIIWTVCAFGGKETADERWGEVAEVNTQWAALARAVQLSWLSCWLSDAGAWVLKPPAPSQSLEEHCMTLVLWFFPVSLRSQNLKEMKPVALTQSTFF